MTKRKKPYVQVPLKVYKRALRDEAPVVLVGIDTGVRTAGASIFRLTRKGERDFVPFEYNGAKVRRMSLPLLFEHVDRSSELFIDVLRERVRPRMSSAVFAIEYPHITGTFSVPLSIYTVLLVRKLLKFNPIAITLVPNFWTIKVRSALKMEKFDTKERTAYLKQYFPEIGDFKEHVVDSTFIALVSNPKFFSAAYGVPKLFELEKLTF